MTDPRHDDRAACGSEDWAIFTLGPGSSGREAKAICGRCPIRAGCLEWAVATRQKGAVWGGMTDGERNRLRRERQAG